MNDKNRDPNCPAPEANECCGNPDNCAEIAATEEE